MQVEEKIKAPVNQKTLKDFIPMVLAFFGALVFWSLYQNLRLFYLGVLDQFLNKSFLLSILHHSGFTAIVALILAFIFNYLEGKKSNLGFRSVQILLGVLLLVEGLLVEYYVQNYEIMEPGVFTNLQSNRINFMIWPILISVPISILICHFLHKSMASFYKVISRMYPFTIILFSLFLATLYSDKKPINENKTQHLISSFSDAVFDFNKYEGTEKFPLLKSHDDKDVLGKYFNLKNEKPNVVIILLEGIGSDFVGRKAMYKGFAPYLDSLTSQSLYWNNFLSNTRESASALPTVLGSLPFGENGFTNLSNTINRNTLYSILKENGYETSFSYGGNSALNKFDKFLEEERVDQVLDKKAFGDEFKLQDKDAAGFSLGYPDAELYRKWKSITPSSINPRLDVLLTLSTKNPFLVPNLEMYENKALAKLEKLSITDRPRKLVEKNIEIFASILYADKALESFMNQYQENPEYENTIFLITGSHNLTDLPQTDELGKYRVPFMIFSPMLKSPKKISSLSSHADIAPSIISLLHKKYAIHVPSKVAWLGDGLQDSNFTDPKKQIPLFRGYNLVKDFILGNHYLSSGAVFKISEHLNLLEDDDAPSGDIKAKLQFFKSVNRYVTENNSLIPESDALFAQVQAEFSKPDMVWVESVFNGKDFDNAYETARNLAHNEDWERSLLLCRYILNQIPRHADTEILMGRIYAWQKNYERSMTILEECVQKYPKYSDGYAALLDTYFWAQENGKAKNLIRVIEQNNFHDPILTKKMERVNQNVIVESNRLGSEPGGLIKQEK